MNVPDKKFRQTLRDMVSGNILFDEPTERHTSIGVGGKTDALVFPQNRDELRQITSYLRNTGIPFIPVGNWTNLIIKDSGYRGVIVSLQCINHVTWSERNFPYVSIDAEAGAALSDIVRLSAGESLTGLEFCAGIPGTVGGAVRMNAGAYGNEIKDVIENVNVMNMSGKISEFKREALKFTYRHMELPEGAILVSASFLLSKGIKEKIREKIREILETRKEKHPLEYRSAGSIFKNPEGLPAGQIIDALGLKGIQIGGAKISEKHGNFIVNTGNAKAKDILALMDMVKKKVWEEKGIHLEPEVRIIGEDG
jgi:UDP-N-acetylmuramate dehydrogenase